MSTFVLKFNFYMKNQQKQNDEKFPYKVNDDGYVSWEDIQRVSQETRSSNSNVQKMKKNERSQSDAKVKRRKT